MAAFSEIVPLKLPYNVQKTQNTSLSTLMETAALAQSRRWTPYRPMPELT
uniref:Uncharacterized protein n=1 Tax=Hyaloperonospora arabidopsidis (strain Emoy2) TaxID=559515 RepID=M4B2I4_HYAAE